MNKSPYDGIFCDEIDLASLLKNSRVKSWSMDSAEAARRLNWILGQFLHDKYWEQAPSATQVARELSSIALAAEKLSKKLTIRDGTFFLQELKPVCVARIEYAARHSHAITLQELIRNIQLLQACAESAKAEALRPPRAKPKRNKGDAAINEFLRDLMCLWNDATGTDATVWTAETGQSAFIQFAFETKKLLASKLTEEHRALDSTVRGKLARLTQSAIVARCERLGAEKQFRKSKKKKI